MYLVLRITYFLRRDFVQYEIELAVEKVKNYKSPGVDQIPAELIKAGGSTIRCAIHKLIIAIWSKEELPGELK